MGLRDQFKHGVRHEEAGITASGHQGANRRRRNFELGHIPEQHTPCRRFREVNRVGRPPRPEELTRFTVHGLRDAGAARHHDVGQIRDVAPAMPRGQAHEGIESVQQAQRATGEGVTSTVRRGLELVARTTAYDRLRTMKGKVKLARAWSALKFDRR